MSYLFRFFVKNKPFLNHFQKELLPRASKLTEQAVSPGQYYQNQFQQYVNEANSRIAQGGGNLTQDLQDMTKSKGQEIALDTMNIFRMRYMANLLGIYSKTSVNPDYVAVGVQRLLYMGTFMIGLAGFVASSEEKGEEMSQLINVDGEKSADTSQQEKERLSKLLKQR